MFKMALVLGLLAACDGSDPILFLSCCSQLREFETQNKQSCCAEATEWMDHPCPNLNESFNCNVSQHERHETRPCPLPLGTECILGDGARLLRGTGEHLGLSYFCAVVDALASSTVFSLSFSLPRSSSCSLPFPISLPLSLPPYVCPCPGSEPGAL